MLVKRVNYYSIDCVRWRFTWHMQIHLHTHNTPDALCIRVESQWTACLSSELALEVKGKVLLRNEKVKDGRQTNRLSAVWRPFPSSTSPVTYQPSVSHDLVLNHSVSHSGYHWKNSHIFWIGLFGKLNNKMCLVVIIITVSVSVTARSV